MMRSVVLVAAVGFLLSGANAQPSATAGFLDISSGSEGPGLSYGGHQPPSVRALAAGPDGRLYAGGLFSVAGGYEVRNLAQRVGGQWQPVGESAVVSGSVTALAASTSALYVADAGAPGYIARWTGAEWQPLGSGVDGQVLALMTAADGRVYAGGEFETAGGVPARGIAAWDGSAWTPVGVGLGTVNALALDLDGSLLAGGRFSTPGGLPSNQVARWSGSGWQVLGDSFGGEVVGMVAGGAGDVYVSTVVQEFVVSTCRIHRWIGTGWEQIHTSAGPPDSPGIRALALDAVGNLHVGGGCGQAARVRSASGSWVGTNLTGFTWDLVTGADGTLYAGADSRAGVHRWTGSTWVSVGRSVDGAVHALHADDGGRLYAGGRFGSAGDVDAPAVALWQDGTWEGFGARRTRTRALAGGADGRLYAGSDDEYGPYAAWSEGGAWTALGLDGPVHALWSDGDDPLYAAGAFTTGSGTTLNHLGRWTGETWEALGSGLDGAAHALARAPDGSLYVGGEFTVAGGVSANRIARWDGTAWHALGAGIDGPVYALAVGPDGSLYAGGDFETAGGRAARRIARWDGNAWHAVGDGLNARVRALLVDDAGAVVAGGDFSFTGVEPGRGIARWDGTTWAPLAGGVAGSVFAMALLPSGDIALGGDFLRTASGPSPYITLYRESLVASAPPLAGGPVVITLAPNPARGASTAWVTGAGEAAVTVHDALGRRVAIAFDGVLAGRTAVALPSGLAPGVYVVRLVAGEAVRSARLVVAR